MNLKLAACSILMIGCVTARAGEDPCLAGAPDWRIGGVSFRADATALLEYGSQCPKDIEIRRIIGHCRAVAPDGFTYIIFADVKANGGVRVFYKERHIEQGERLPFGIALGDSPDVALQKIDGLGSRGGRAFEGRKLWAVEVKCGDIPKYVSDPRKNYYFINFNLGEDGRVNSVSEQDESDGDANAATIR